MKTSKNSSRFVLLPASGWLLVSLIAAYTLAVPTRAADPVAPPKDHALFMGGDLSVEYAGSRRLIVGVGANEAFVRVDGKRVGVPLAKLAGMRVERNLKLSETVALIGDFGAKPTIARRANRDQQWLDQMADMQSVADQAQVDSMKYSSEADKALARSGYESNDYVRARSASDNAASFERQASDLLTASRSGAMALPDDEARSALAVSCTLASPKPAKDAFALVVVEFRETVGGPRQQQVQLELLKPLGPAPHGFACTVAGLPAGFILERCDLHLFADGLEIASNLSEKRMDLTADDAMRFMVASYVSEHLNESLAASPLRLAVPAGFRQRAKAGWLDMPVYLTVAANGTVAKAAAGPDGAALDPELDGVVRRFWFAPALDAGSPVESLVTVRLADYLR